MIGRKFIFFAALLLIPVMVLEGMDRRVSRTQREIIDNFARLPVYAPGLVEPTENLMDYSRIRHESEVLVQSLYGEESGTIAEFGFISPTHLFLELAIQPESVDQLPIFGISNHLQKRLGLNANSSRVSYAELSDIRSSIRTLAKQNGLSGLELLPGESVEVKQFENRLVRYEAVRNIFKLGATQDSLSQYLTELIAFLPEGMEQYQNQLEGLPYDQEMTDRYLSVWEALNFHYPYYGMIPERQGALQEYETLEMTVRESLDRRLFNPVSMWFAEFYDTYREGDFRAARKALDEMLHATDPHMLGQASFPAFGPGSLLATIFKGLAIFCALAGILFALIAIPTGKKAGIIAVALAAVATAYHLGWLFIQSRIGNSIVWLHLSLLLNVFALLPLLGLIYYRAALVLGGILLEAAVILFQVHAPILVGPYDLASSVSVAPNWLTFWVFLSQVTGVFAVGVIWQMLFGCIVIHYNSRVFDDQRLRLRQLMSVTLPLLRVAMIALLFSVGISVALFRVASGWYPFGYVTLVCSLAILIQCSIFLQLRWINRLNLAELGKNYLTLLILSLFLLLSYGDFTLAYFPDSMIARFSPLLKWIVFVVGGITILTFYTVPAANRLREWIDGYRKSLKSRQTKKPVRSK